MASGEGRVPDATRPTEEAGADVARDLTAEERHIARDIEGYLAEHQRKELLRFVFCGSVDDGKSTLLGRLLHDTQGIYEDQLAAVRRASRLGDAVIDFSLFTDGLKAEREQGITIDVAYRYFSTAKRKFIVADTPGHVQYTRNMATGASTANVAVILVDARFGVLQQSRRHAYIATLLGIPHLAVAINKMDLVGYDQAIFERHRADFADVAARLGAKDVTTLPLSALAGVNVVRRAPELDWYSGPTLLEYLETVPIGADRNVRDFRLPVQLTLRPHLDYRGFAGQIASGTLRQGDELLVLPSGKRSRVVGIDTYEGPLAEAGPPLGVTVRLDDEIDISRGDMLVHPDAVPTVAQRFDAVVVWMSEAPLDLRRGYLIKHTTQYVRARFERVAWRMDLGSLEREPAATLELNDIGEVRVVTQRPLFFDAYAENRATGAFIVIDALTNDTVGAGMIERAAGQDRTEAPDGARGPVGETERRHRLGHAGGHLRLTGTSPSDRAAVAVALERRLFDRGCAGVVVLPALPDALAERLTAAGLLVIETAPAPGAEHGLAVDVGSIATRSEDRAAALVERLHGMGWLE